jgi:hypothetical protein
MEVSGVVCGVAAVGDLNCVPARSLLAVAAPLTSLCLSRHSCPCRGRTARMREKEANRLQDVYALVNNIFTHSPTPACLTPCACVFAPHTARRCRRAAGCHGPNIPHRAHGCCQQQQPRRTDRRNGRAHNHFGRRPSPHRGHRACLVPRDTERHCSWCRRHGR